MLAGVLAGMGGEVSWYVYMLAMLYCCPVRMVCLTVCNTHTDDVPLIMLYI